MMFLIYSNFFFPHIFPPITHIDDINMTHEVHFWDLGYDLHPKQACVTKEAGYLGRS